MDNKSVVLAILRHKLEVYKDIKHKKMALVAAIRMIESMTSVDSVEKADLLKIKFIGPKIATWIVDEYVEFVSKSYGTKKDLIQKLRSDHELLSNITDEALLELGYQRLNKWNSTLNNLESFISSNGFEAYLAGSVRRKSLIIHDFDFVSTMTYEDLIKVVNQVNEEDNLDYSLSIINKGKKRVRVLLTNSNLQTLEGDFRLIPSESLATALLYFTGPAGLNIQMRGIAKAKGFTLNEYEVKSNGQRLHFAHEREIFEFLGMKYLEPTERV